MPSNPACERCTLASPDNYGLRCVWGEGSITSSIMLIGEALGETEEADQRPFVGQSGQLLDKTLTSLGVRRQDVYITNINKCRPPGNRTPTPVEQAACLPYLLAEIEQVKPKVILALGGSALKALTGKEGAGKERGKVHAGKPALRLGSTVILNTWHPSYYLHKRDPQIPKDIATDLRLAFATAGVDLSKKPEPSQALQSTIDPLNRQGVPRTYLLPGYTDVDLRAALEPLQVCKAVTCDLEWTGVEGEPIRWPWSGRGATCYSISITGRPDPSVTGVRGLVSVGISHLQVTPRPLPILQEFFNTHPIIAHNAQADLLWLGHLGYKVKLGGDTMGLTHFLDTNQKLSLEQLASLYAGMPAGWKDPPWPQAPSTQMEWRRLLSHNMGDTEATFMVIEALMRELRKRPQLEQDNIKKVYTKIFLPLVPMFTDVATAGVGLDHPGLNAAITTFESELRQEATDFGRLLDVGPDAAEAIAMSPTKSLAVLQRSFGLKIFGSSKDALLDHLDEPPVKHIHNVRSGRKTLGTYLKPWRDLNSRDRRMHTVYRLTGAATGRISAEVEYGGSLMVAPRDPRIRGLLKATNPGWKIAAADESQVELRVVADVANERHMRELFADSKSDLHKTTAGYNVAMGTDGLSAAEFWKIRHEYEARVTKAQRQGGKSENFGLVYGMGPPHFRAYLLKEFGIKISIEQAEIMHAGYHALYPDIQKWHRQTVDEYKERGYTLTPFGRYRRGMEPHKAINTPIQSIANDITLLAMLEIREEFFKERLWSFLIGFGHDCVLAECHPQEQDQVREIMTRHMEHPPLWKLDVPDLAVPLMADVQISERWSIPDPDPDTLDV